MWGQVCSFYMKVYTHKYFIIHFSMHLISMHLMQNAFILWLVTFDDTHCRHYQFKKKSILFFLDVSLHASPFVPFFLTIILGKRVAVAKEDCVHKWPHQARSRCLSSASHTAIPQTDARHSKINLRTSRHHNP